MHRIQCALFLCSGHYELSLIELPLAISKSYHYKLRCPFFQSYQIQPDIKRVSDILQDQSTTSWRRQTYISNTDYLALFVVSHHYRAMIPSYVSREALSRWSYMERHTRVDHPGALFTCKICACLLTNEQDLLLTCSNSRCALFLRNIAGFDILWGTFVLLNVSTIFLEMFEFSTIKACKLTSGLGPGLGFVRSLWTSLSVPSSTGMLSHIWLWLRQDTFVLPSWLLVQHTCLYHLYIQVFFLTWGDESHHQVLPTVRQSTHQ